MIFGQPIEDGLFFQTKSYAQNVTDMQDIGTAMLSGYMASKRRLVGDRMVFDPSRISSKDINSRNPAAKIPVRPSAYGKPIGEAFAVMPYRDEQTHSLLEGAQIVSSYADRINGQNPAQQGQFVKGNKTLHEFQDTQGHSNDRNQLMATCTEDQVFSVVKEIVKLNTLQFQKDGEVFNRDKGTSVSVSVTDLRKAAIHFKVSDGELPVDKLMSTDEYQTVVQTIGSSPTLASGYNMSPLFSYLVKVQSGIDLSPFQKSPLQMQFEQMQGQWQQIAEAALKAGQQPPPQPQMPPELTPEEKMQGMNLTELQKQFITSERGFRAAEQILMAMDLDVSSSQEFRDKWQRSLGYMEALTWILSCGELAKTELRQALQEQQLANKE
jgi:hypothetical protein